MRLRAMPRQMAERQTIAVAARERLRTLDAGERVVRNKITEFHDRRLDAAEFWRRTAEQGAEQRQGEGEEQTQRMRPRLRM
jgi:hypothetical protein